MDFHNNSPISGHQMEKSESRKEKSEIQYHSSVREAISAQNFERIGK
jgi:hypothetical protein